MQNTTEKQAPSNAINLLNSLVTENNPEIGWRIEAAKVLLLHADNKPTLDLNDYTVEGIKQLLQTNVQSGGDSLD